MDHPLSVQTKFIRHWLMPFALVISICFIFFKMYHDFLPDNAWLYRPYYFFSAIYIFSRGWTPDTPISSKHLKFIAIGLIEMALVVTFFALLGFGTTSDGSNNKLCRMCECLKNIS